MKILFDSQIFDSQKYGGISRYFCELFKSFNKIRDLTYELPIRDTRNEYLKETEPFSKMSLERRSIFSNLSLKLQRLLNKMYDLTNINSNMNRVKKALKEGDFDIFHPTYYSTYFLKYLKDKPLVLTVYDMTHEIYPEYFPFYSGWMIKQKNKLLQKADKIIAISENTKKDIIQFHKIPEYKIKVIYLGNSLQLTQDKPLNFPEIPKKYILFVGSRDNYKNFSYFIKSISPILQNDRALKVVAAGGYSGKNNFSRKEKNLFRKLEIDRQILQYPVTDEFLAYLYQNAICFIFPSLYEGFGLPVLEAFACDCPAVISNTSSLPEVGGEAAQYFNPMDSNDILSTVRKVITDEKLRREMVIKGREQLKRFSWVKTAQETLNLYREIIQK
jgi:glycosyltransferase involved in cell wall biosynthesis